jgi:hypothetical protein
MEHIDNLWIPLADETRLAARIWLPDDAACNPVPAVLEYLPYRKSDATALADRVRHPYFATHGYAAVRVDLRGSGDSDGLLRGEYLRQEQDDALEVLAWLARQPWCTGDVGMIGYSWGGFNGLQIAARRPPELKAVITIASTDDRYLDDCHYMGGCLLASDMLKWAASMLAYTLQPPDPRFAGDRRREIWLERLAEAPELARDWISHQLRDAFWKHGSVAEDYDAIRCPVMAVGGWADAYTNAVPRLLAGLSVPRLGLIGPWGHMMPHEGVPGPAMDFLREAVRWWDRWLKGIDTGIMDEPCLRIWIQDYVEPAGFHATRPGRWVAEPSWPPPDTHRLTLRLSQEGRLKVSDSRGRSPKPGQVGGSPAPVAFRGVQECGETAGVWCANGNPDEIAVDQGPDDERSLCFSTEPLSTPVEVLGFPVVSLRVSADRPRALIAARLEDVAADGSSLLVSWGMLNLTHRNGHERPEPLVAGSWYEVTIESRVCGHLFETGHSIRLALSPTYWPHAWPSPDPVTLLLEVDGASALHLPVRVPADGGDPQVAVDSSLAVDPPVTVDSPVGPFLSLAGAEQPGGGAAPSVRRDVRTRRLLYDAQNSRHEIVDHEEHERTIPDTGVVYTEIATDVYSIVEDAPLSATVRCSRETRSTHPSLEWQVTVQAEMTCDADHFFVREEYWASEGGSLVFSEAREHTIPRDGV